MRQQYQVSPSKCHRASETSVFIYLENKIKKRNLKNTLIGGKKVGLVMTSKRKKKLQVKYEKIMKIIQLKNKLFLNIKLRRKATIRCEATRFISSRVAALFRTATRHSASLDSCSFKAMSVGCYSIFLKQWKLSIFINIFILVIS